MNVSMPVCTCTRGAPHLGRTTRVTHTNTSALLLSRRVPDLCQHGVDVAPAATALLASPGPPYQSALALGVERLLLVLDMRLRMGAGSAARVPWRDSLGKGDWKGWRGYSGLAPLGDYLHSNIRNGFTYTSLLDASRSISWRMCMRISEFMSRT